MVLITKITKAFWQIEVYLKIKLSFIKIQNLKILNNFYETYI